MPVLTTTEIMDLIPNRYPILYMDYVEEMVPDESIVAVKKCNNQRTILSRSFSRESCDAWCFDY